MKVLFLIDEHPTTVIAVFPEVKEHTEGYVSCIDLEDASIVKLSDCGKLPLATPEQYEPLLHKLRNDGYNKLEILNQSAGFINDNADRFAKITAVNISEFSKSFGDFMIPIMHTMVLTRVAEELKQDKPVNPVTHDNKN